MSTEWTTINWWKQYLSRAKLAKAVQFGIRRGLLHPERRVGEGDGDNVAAAAQTAATGGATQTTTGGTTQAVTGSQTNPATGKTFTQPEVDKLMENHRKGLQEKYKTMEKQLSEMLEKTNLTEQERTNLQQQLESVQSETRTKEELHKTEVQKLQEKSAKELAMLKAQAETWQNRYVTQTVSNALLSAAVKAKAFNPDQILDLLSAKARVQEEIGEDQKATGRFGVKVKINILKDGKPTELDLVPEEALKILAEQPEYANLFVDRSTPGLGGGNGNGTSRLPALSAETSMDDYRKNRAQYMSAAGK